MRVRLVWFVLIAGMIGLATPAIQNYPHPKSVSTSVERDFQTRFVPLSTKWTRAGGVENDSARTYSLSIAYASTDIYPGRLLNAQIAVDQMQAFFDSVQLAPGVEYSFNRDVLGETVARSRGYVTTRNGYGDGLNGAASALNMLVHKTFFWDQYGVEKLLFEQIHALPLKNDPTFGPFAVGIYLDPTTLQDYIWWVNPAYDGTAPHITCHMTATTITLTVAYTNEYTPPANPSKSERRANLTSSLHAIIGDQHVGVSVISAADPTAKVEVNANAQVPIASAWKGPGTIYFFENVSPSVWGNLPIRYWNVKHVEQVPAEYQTAWLNHHQILSEVYVMAVFSGNHEAANVLAYIYKSLPHDQTINSNPIRAFNEWSQQTVGISNASGMFNWQYGDLTNPAIVDIHFAERRLDIGSKSLFYANTYSAHDLALFYLHLATVGKERGYYDTAVELLSIRTEIVSKIEGQAFNTAIHTATKDGYFVPGSPLSLGHEVNNDAGLLIFPDGRLYIVAFTAFDAVDVESDAVGLVIRALIM